MKVWLLWTVSDETLEDLLLSIHATMEAAEVAMAEHLGEFEVGETDYAEDNYWINEWAVNE